MKVQTHYSSLLIVFLLTVGSFSGRSQFEKLDSLDGFGAKIYYSKGQKARALEMATLMEGALKYNDSLLQFRPAVSLLILSPADWSGYTSFPVYGMPHYPNDHTLVVAAEDNDLWRSFIPPIGQLPPSLAGQVKTVYSQHDGTLSMQPFFDLLALHELGHAYHRQAALKMQRKWMGELFCNIFLHTYIADRQPQRLPALTVFPNMVVAGGGKDNAFNTLDQFEKNYTEIGKKYPKNYGWYQCRLHAAAREIYDAAGKDALRKLWKTLQDKADKDDQQLSELLAAEVHPAVANVLLKW